MLSIEATTPAGVQDVRSLSVHQCFFFFGLNNNQFIIGMWTLDPIDGTKGFLRGGQYAVCLALIVDARVELGIIGCPNLPSTPPPPSSTTTTVASANDDDDAQIQVRGALFVAVRGHGAYQLPITTPESPPPTTASRPTPAQGLQRLSMPRLALHDLSFLESVEKAHAALDTNALVATRLGVRATPVRMDSQAKYAALVRGDGGGGVYLRLPVAGPNAEGGYQEKIWVRVRKCRFSFLLTHRVLCFFICLFLVCLFRIMPLGRSWWKRPAESSRIILGDRLTLALDARSVGILASSRRGGRSMHG
jgi:3'-phosphoadenosine 5'-phosphosulfate (PAPS) 3'-phosphatase